MVSTQIQEKTVTSNNKRLMEEGHKLAVEESMKAITICSSENLLDMLLYLASTSPDRASEGQAHRRWNSGHRVGAKAAAGGNRGPVCFDGS